MSRFNDDDYDYFDGPCITWQMWEHNVRRALGSARGQQALVQVEEALLALPQPRLVRGHLAAKGQVCTVGALVAYRQAQEQGRGIADVIEVLCEDVYCECLHPRAEHHDDGPCAHVGSHWRTGEPQICDCEAYVVDEEQEDVSHTKAAGVSVGLTRTLAEHLAYLNDEEFRSCTPEERYERVLEWIRRALGREQVAA